MSEIRKMAKHRDMVVCADEKTCIQAIRNTGGIMPAGPGHSLRCGPRYERNGITHLFAALLVHSGETMVRFMERKRFVDFQEFLRMTFQSLWTKRIKALHLILDNGPTHAPKQIEPWIESLRLPFAVQIHWLPKNASWLDQVENVFSPLERKILTPRNFQNIEELKNRMCSYFEERNKNPKPIQWSYTKDKLYKQFGAKPHERELVLCA